MNGKRNTFSTLKLKSSTAVRLGKLQHKVTRKKKKDSLLGNTNVYFEIHFIKN